ncbi:putative quinol monooxygenase [Streptomyces vilmorinianum]|uniref:putative quinol monooxygenase n=1 Tax=Streptomyces vilmorinianum TaxID=3051092 RepID=UPI0010FAFBC3|nr:antibiotic biosynthesis monooxygenase [Streptomyces vilmorinianum]
MKTGKAGKAGKVGMVAHHYPHAAHREEFIARVHQVAEEFRRTPGCLSAECWTAGDAVVSIVRWESEGARDASLAAVMGAGLDLAYDDRESRPREILGLVES